MHEQKVELLDNIRADKTDMEKFCAVKKKRITRLAQLLFISFVPSSTYRQED